MTGRRSLLMPAAAGAVLLTMLSLNQVFVRQRWLFPSIVAVGVAFGVGWLGRRLDVPGVLAPALSVLALVTWLGIAFHPATTIFGIPTGETMRAIGESLRQSGVDIRELSAPAEATDPLTLLSTTGVFLVAVLVDIVVFRLRRPVVAGIPLLALFLVPTSLATKANAFTFVLAAFGYLGLLVAEGRDRARAWGRRLSGIDRLDELGDVSHVARVGRRIGTAAVGLALALPVALPSVGDGMFSGGTGPFGRGNGDSRVVVISPIAEIRKQLHDPLNVNLLSVRPHEGPNGYTRLTSLDEFNGNEWRLIEQEADEDRKVGRKDPIPQPPEHERVATARQTYDVAVGPLAVQWLPLPYSPRVVDVKGDWKYEPETLSVFTAREGRSSRDVTFTVTSLLPRPTPDQLRQGGPIPESIATRYLRLPSRPPHPLVNEVLDQVIGTIENPYDKAMALQTFFREKGKFKYSLDAPEGTSDDALADFLRQRIGYCEQFAATMAYLARLTDIPARVAVGFTAGTQQSDGSWLVTNRDAHAWPELYFPSAGWVRFEPTPRSDDATDVPDWAVPTGSAGNGVDPPLDGDPTPSPDDPTPTATPGLKGADDVPDDPPDGTADDLAVGGGGPVRPLLAGGLLVAVLLSVPALVGYVARRRRRALAVDPKGRTHAAWDALADAAEDAGFPLRAADSPRTSARRLVAAAGLAGSVGAEVTRLASAEERARYARSATPVDGLDASARTVRKALLASMSRWARVRALVFPASSLRRMRAGYASLNEALDRSRTAIRAKAGALVRRRPAFGRG